MDTRFSLRVTLSATISLLLAGAVTGQTPASTAFLIGDRVVGSTGGVLARAAPSITESRYEQKGLVEGVVLDGPLFVDGYWWWLVDYATGMDGWSTELNLVKVATVVQPTRPRIVEDEPFRVSMKHDRLNTTHYRCFLNNKLLHEFTVPVEGGDVLCPTMSVPLGVHSVSVAAVNIGVVDGTPHDLEARSAEVSFEAVEKETLAPRPLTPADVRFVQ